jgi:hypothetical protein
MKTYRIKLVVVGYKHLLNGTFHFDPAASPLTQHGYMTQGAINNEPHIYKDINQAMLEAQIQRTMTGVLLALVEEVS